jgi:hypothetical protein
MSELSPAARAVFDAYISHWTADPYEISLEALAATLRAAVEQVMPEVVNAVGDEHDDARRDQWVRIRCKFLAIADELET